MGLLYLYLYSKKYQGLKVIILHLIFYVVFVRITFLKYNLPQLT